MKVLGSVQLYVAPAIVFAVKLIVLPAHNGDLLHAVGAAGIGLIATVMVDTALPQPDTLTNTL